MKRLVVVSLVLAMLTVGFAAFADPINVGGEFAAAAFSPINVGGPSVVAFAKVPPHAQAFGLHRNLDAVPMFSSSPINVGGE